jgi:hypothetical protein
MRSYTLLLDGKPVAQIRQGQTVEIEIPPRELTAQMQIDWAFSKPLQIDGTKDVTLRCRANGNPFLALFWITVWKDNYIRLWQVD